MAQKRSRQRVLSYTLAAVLVILTAPTLVILTFMRSLPDDHAGEFRTHVAGRGGGARGGGRMRFGKRLPSHQPLDDSLDDQAGQRLHRLQVQKGGVAPAKRNPSELNGAIMRNGGSSSSQSGDTEGSEAASGGSSSTHKRSSHATAAADGSLVLDHGSVHDHTVRAGVSGRGQLAATKAASSHTAQEQHGLHARHEAQEQQPEYQQGTQQHGQQQQPHQQQQQGQQGQQGQLQRSRHGGKRASIGEELAKPLNGSWPNLLPQGTGPLLPRPNCVDKQPGQQCKGWAANGGCEKNPDFMYRNCPASCGICTVRYLHGAEVPQQVQVVPGVYMPTVGYGTAGLTDLTADAVFTAIRLGYRLVDSAEAREWYREDLVGWGWSASGIKREHLFITTKVHPRNLGYWSTLDAFNEMLQDLQTNYVDLVLLHYPECWGALCGDAKVEGTWQDSWAALEQLVHEKKLRAAGVSNFNLDQMAELVRVARVKPALLQANSDLLRQNWELQAYCRRHGIQFQGYSSLGGQWLAQTQGQNPVLDHPTLTAIAQRLGKTTAQVVLRWALQHGQAVVPRTSKVNRMEQNLDLFSFDLSDADMQALDGLDGSMELTRA